MATMSMHRKEFEGYLKLKGYTRTTIESRLVIYDKYTEWLSKEGMEAEEVTYSDLLSFVKYCKRKGATQRTVQSYVGTLKHYYAHLIREKRIDYNPATDIKVKGIKRKAIYYILSPQELHQLYNGYQDDTLAGRRNKAMLGLLIYQGLTAEELAKLEVSDIKLREGKIEVPGGRRSNHRTMNLESHQVLDLYDYTLQTRPELIKEEPKGPGKVDRETRKLFIGSGGISSSFSNYTSQLIKDLKQINLKLQNAKQIRASVITKWLKQYNLRETQYLAGHRYISTTESYQQNDVEGLAEEINMYHPL